MTTYYGGDKTVWSTWTSNTTCTSTAMTWDDWNTSTYEGTASTYNIVWTTWNDAEQGTYISYDSGATPWVSWASEAEIEAQHRKEKHQNRLERRKARALQTRAERKRLQKLADQQRRGDIKRLREEKRRQKIEVRRKQRAEETAWKLLEDIVTPEETKRYKETGRLLVHGQTYDWLVKKPAYEGGKPGVVRVEKGKLTDICVHTNNGRDSEIPEADRIVSIALSAKFNEKAFDEKCNKWGDVQMPDEYLKECANF